MRLSSLLFFSSILSISFCDTIIINDANDLITFSDSVNSGSSYSGTTVFLTADIDFTDYSEQFAPIGNSTNGNVYFLGTFDGQGHTISNLALNTSSDYVGLFGYSAGITIKNIVIDNTCSFSNSASGSDAKPVVGSILGYCNPTSGSCTIENSVNMASVAFEGNVNDYISLGGIVGYLYSYSYSNYIKNCVNYGTVTYSGIVGSGNWVEVGGIIGSSDGSSTSSYNYIQNCANYGTIIHSGASTGAFAIGGVVGFGNYGSIENCVSSGVISTNQDSDYIGTIIGHVSSTTEIDHCYWTSGVGYSSVYGYKESIATIINTELASIDQATVDKLNEYAAKNDTWSKWFMVHLDGGSINNITQESLAEIQGRFPDPVKEENTFLFWCKDAECNDVFYPKTDSVSGITDIYAKWVINNYTVTFDFGNGTTINVSFSYGLPIVYPNGVVREGYTFNGWDSTPDKMPAKDITITAQWTLNNYTVTFDFDNGTTVNETFSYGSLIVYPVISEREGYVFSRWNNYHEFMPAENITITAQWTEILSQYVEVVFGTKDLEIEEIKEIIKMYTDEEFDIEEFKRDSETGETRVIIKFVDEKKAVDFVRTVDENKDQDSLVKRVNVIPENNNFSSSLTITISFFLSFVLFFCVNKS